MKPPALAAALAFAAWPSVGRAQYTETEDACLLTLHPGTAPDDGALSDVDSLLKTAYAFTSEFEPLPFQEVLEIDGEESDVDSPGAAKCRPSTFLSLPVADIFEHPGFGFQRGAARVYDLGAGYGRPILQAVLKHGAAEGVGVELSQTRWRKSCMALRQLAGLLAPPERRPRDRPTAVVELRLGDASKADIAGATNVLLFATCFPAPVVEGLQYKLLQELPLGARVCIVGDRGVWRAELSDSAHEQSRTLRVLERGSDPDDIARKIWRLDTTQEAEAAAGAGASDPSARPEL